MLYCLKLITMLLLAPLAITQTGKGREKCNSRHEKCCLSECNLRIARTTYTIGLSIKMDPSCSYAKRRHNFSEGSFAILHRNYVNRFSQSFLDLRSFSDRTSVPVRLWIAKIPEIVFESENRLWRQYEWRRSFISLTYLHICLISVKYILYDYREYSS